MRHRAAHTLVELVVSMTVGSALMVLAVGLLHQSLSLASTARTRANQFRTLDRLAQDFRRDAHLATSVVTPDAQRLELTTEDGGVIRYLSVLDESEGTRIRARGKYRWIDRATRGVSICDAGRRHL